MRTLALLLASLLLTACAAGPTYRVGPNRQYKKVSDLLPKLKAGDVVEIDPGIYREAMKLKANGTATQPIVLRGVAGKPRPVFDAEGVPVTGKGAVPRAIFQVEGAHWVLEHLEARNARNGDTAACVRLNGSTNAVIRDCYLHHSDLGVFGNDKQTVTIENCEIAFNSTETWNGYAHNFYMHGNRVVVRNCYIHDSPFGQNFKSRARYNELWFNWIADSNEGEVGPVDEHSREKTINTGLPESNTLLVGNVIVSKPRGGIGNPSKFVLFGSELKAGDSAGHNGTLYLFHNTFVAGTDSIVFIQLADPQARLVAANNIFYGSDRIFGTLKAPAAGVLGRNNLIPPRASAPDGWRGTIQADPKFVDAVRRDFRLAPGSAAIDAGAGSDRASRLAYVDSNGKEKVLLGWIADDEFDLVWCVPEFINRLDRSPWAGMHARKRTLVGKPDIGAYEFGAKRVTTRGEWE